MIIFIIWAITGLLFCGFGFFTYRAVKPVRFWNISHKIIVKEIKQYNKAVGNMWSIFGIVFILLGLPLLAGQNAPYVLITIFGTVFECIVLMAVYTKIEGKYRKN